MKRIAFIAFLMAIFAYVAYAAPPPTDHTNYASAISSTSCIAAPERGSPTLATCGGKIIMIIANINSTPDGSAAATQPTARSIVGNEYQLNFGIPPGEQSFFVSVYNLDPYSNYTPAEAINAGAESLCQHEEMHASASSAYPVGRNGDCSILMNV